MWEVYGFPAWDDTAYERLSVDQLERMVITCKHIAAERAS